LKPGNESFPGFYFFHSMNESDLHLIDSLVQRQILWQDRFVVSAAVLRQAGG
jgi:hypothetical protein